MSEKTFLSVNFGCRVNAAETNQFSQLLLNAGYQPTIYKPDIIFVNTCSVTKKANIESLSRVRVLHRQYPNIPVIVSGCADLLKIKKIPDVFTFNNLQKEKILDLINDYTPQIKDKYSHTHRYILKIQSGCNHFCSYCIVPYKRPDLFSLPISQAVKITNSALQNGYKEIIITGTNLNLYQPGLSNLLESLLSQTKILLVSFGSVPLNCLDKKFISLFKKYSPRLSNYLHIPLQSGSDRILQLMHRPYTRNEILSTFSKLKNLVPPLSSKRGLGRDFVLATDIIVGFPGETESDFQDTLGLCRRIGFAKIHIFKFSPRPGTSAWNLYQKCPKIMPKVIKFRSNQLKCLLSPQPKPRLPTPNTAPKLVKP